MQCYPSPQILSLCRQGFFPLQNAKPSQNASLQIIIFQAIFIYLFIYFFFSFFHYHFLWIFFSFFLFHPQNWNSSPKWKNYSPAFEGNNRRIDAPVKTVTGLSFWVKLDSYSDTKHFSTLSSELQCFCSDSTPLLSSAIKCSCRAFSDDQQNLVTWAWNTLVLTHGAASLNLG